MVTSTKLAPDAIVTLPNGRPPVKSSRLAWVALVGLLTCQSITVSALVSPVRVMRNVSVVLSLLPSLRTASRAAASRRWTEVTETLTACSAGVPLPSDTL